MEENWYDLIEDYHQNRLTKSLQAQFEAAMAADQELATAVQERRMQWDMQELLAENVLRAQIRQQFLAQPGPREKNAWSANNWKWAGLLLLLLLLIGGIGFFIFSNKAEKTPETPSSRELLPTSSQPVAQTPDPDSTVPKPSTAMPENRPPDFRRLALASYRIPNGVSDIRGPVDNTAITLANQAFKAKNYRHVVELLTKLPDEDVQEALLLRAHAQFNTGDYAAASNDFSALEEAGIYRRDGEWFGVLSRLAMPGADKNRVKKKLDAIRKQASHPYQKQAAALWEQITPSK